MVAHEHETGVYGIELGLFDFIDSIYQQVLLVTFGCCKNNIGDRDQWLSLPEKQFFTYFAMNLPEEGKELLREKFKNEPRIEDLHTRRQFAAITNHFHKMLGLGASPVWTEQSNFKKTAEIFDVSSLVDRPIRWAVVYPERRKSHLEALLGEVDFAEQNGAVEMLKKNQYGEAGLLIIEGMTRSNKGIHSEKKPEALTYL